MPEAIFLILSLSKDAPEVVPAAPWIRAFAGMTSGALGSHSITLIP